MAHNTSSPLAGILMTAFFGIISTVLGVVTMYQVHSLWVKYHHQRKENRDLDIEQRNSSMCMPTTDTEEWQETPEISLRPIVDQIYTIPHHHHHGELLPPDDGIITRCLAGDGEEGTFDLSTGVISRFSTDSDSCASSEGEGEGIQAPPSTPESEMKDEKDGM